MWWYCFKVRVPNSGTYQYCSSCCVAFRPGCPSSGTPFESAVASIIRTPKAFLFLLVDAVGEQGFTQRLINLSYIVTILSGLSTDDSSINQKYVIQYFLPPALCLVVIYVIGSYEGKRKTQEARLWATVYATITVRILYVYVLHSIVGRTFILPGFQRSCNLHTTCASKFTGHTLY